MIARPPSAGSADEDHAALDDVPLPWRAWLITIVVLTVIGVGYFHAIAPGERAKDRREALRELRDCEPAEDALVDAVLDGRVADDEGTFVDWVTRRGEDAPEVWYVSAEHRDAGLSAGADGEIATWAVRALDGPGDDIVAVDPIAAEHTSWSRNSDPVDVRDPGAIGSRRCVANLRKDDVHARWP